MIIIIHLMIAVNNKKLSHKTQSQF